MRWTKEELESYELRRKHSRDRGAGTVAIVEPTPVHDALAAAPIQETNSQRFIVRVLSIRKRLLDEDNLAEKFIVDQLRYAGIIPDDCPETTKIEVSQRKCQGTEPERVRIEIQRI